MKTVSYVSRPQDSRCNWWSKHIPASFTVGRLDDVKSLNQLPFLKRGADIELLEGDAVIDSEANHHRKMRGYRVTIGVVSSGTLKWITPSLKTKEIIKEWASEEQWDELRHGSGDVAACLRYLKAYRLGFRMEDL